MEALLRYWHGVIKKDLAGFADPRSDVSIDISNRTLEATWVVRGRQRTATFRLSTERDFRWLPGGDAEALPYRWFLRSEDMADFDQLSAAIDGAFQPERIYVSTKATTEGSTEENESDDLLLRVVSDTLQAAAGKTRMLFVKGDAGAGKTTLLRQLTGDQARNYRDGNASCPFLFMYVSAQGRALSNLRDAISGELDDLRAGFTRDAVPALVRHGLLVPIIDGFDELLGVAGYGDAFGSLHQFLTEIEGEGAMIVSARSAFYDVEFVGRRTSEDLAEAQYDVEPVTLSPWQEEELHRYLALARKVTSINERDQRALESLRSGDRDLLSKPFFASRFPEYVDAHDGAIGAQSILDYLVDAYVERESGKITDRDGKHLVPINAHRQLFVEATEWMWGAESRDLGEDDLRFLAELTADSAGLSGNAAQQFVAKITSYHGFQTAGNGGQRRFRFEHEIYFDYFLACAVRARLDDPSSMATFLDRGIIPEEVVRSSVDADNATICLALPPKLPRQSVLQENRRRNLGSLIAAALAERGKISDIELSDLSFANVSFGAVDLEHVRFRRCMFNNVGLDRARFEDCQIENSHLDRIIVSDETRLNIVGLEPGTNLRCMYDVIGGRDTYVPSEMAKLLRRLGTPGIQALPTQLSRKALATIALLQRVVQKYRRTNLLCLEDDTLHRLFQDSSWPTLHGLLVEHGIVSEESRQTSGAKKTFLRPQIAIMELLRYESTPTASLPSASVGDFWRAVRVL